MTLADFIASLSLETPPQGITAYLQALWWDGKGNWQRAHDIIEDLGDDTAAWVHAYLHRKEGDNGNARYWYARAGRKFSSVDNLFLQAIEISNTFEKISATSKEDNFAFFARVGVSNLPRSRSIRKDLSQLIK